MVTRSILEALRGWPGLLVAVGAASAYGCQVERNREPGDTVHPVGFIDQDSSAFHGRALAESGYPLGGCRGCHGDDYAGGNVGNSCVTSGCHTEGVESCSTCHLAEPTSGSHAAHSGEACVSCHPARSDARGSHHPDGVLDLVFGPLARAQGSQPTFDAATQGCSNVYCHGGIERQWGGPGPLDCGSCHEAPPQWHAQFAAPLPADPDLELVDTECVACHDTPETHLNGQLDPSVVACDTCHGAGPLGAPPPGVDGTPSSPAIGAHARHLDPTLTDRIGRVTACDDCHVVPTSVASNGHIDLTAPADVVLHTEETYAPAEKRCDVACHWNLEPGPRWDDDSGAARACDSCHAFPPDKTRTGTTHPPAAADLHVCVTCHLFDPSTHVDGQVDFAW